MPKPSVDVVILCALPAEYGAVRRHLTGLRELTHRAGTVYEVGDLAAGSRPTVALVEVGQGNPASASACERAVSYFEPSVALFVGVAGGLKDVKLGDVVASDRVLAYESGKVTGRYLPRITSHVAAVRLVERARAVARGAGWRRRLPDKSLLPNAFVAPIAAGEKVVASQRSQLRAFLARQCSDALAVEMEGFGFLHAAWRNPPVEALVIRGVSDVLVKSEEADAQWQPIAAAHAAAFAVEVLARLEFRTRSPAGPDDVLTRLGIDSSSISRRLDRLRDPVHPLFGGIGSCSEVGYRGRDWDVVTLRIADEELDIFFDTLLDNEMGSDHGR